VVDAFYWSPQLNRNIQTTHDDVKAATNWLAEQRVGRNHGQETDAQQAKKRLADMAVEWVNSDPSKGYNSRQTDVERLKAVGVVIQLEEPGQAQVAALVGKPTGLAAIALSRITEGDVRDVINKWKAARGAWTVKGRRSTLSAIFKYAETKRARPKRSNPCDDIKVDKPEEASRPVHRPDDHGPDDFVGVFSVSNDDLICLADAMAEERLIVWLGSYYGLRWEESGGLTVLSVQALMTGLVKINQVLTRQRTLKPKTKTLAGRRDIVDDVDDELNGLIAEIKAHMLDRGLTLNSKNADGTPAFLFVEDDGGPLDYQRFYNRWRSALKRAGLDQRKPDGHFLGTHDLRSMNRSIMDDQGIPPAVARDRFGHSSGTSAERMDGTYIRISPAQKHQASRRVAGVLRRQPLENQG
jgi:hypothetical protein